MPQVSSITPSRLLLARIRFTLLICKTSHSQLVKQLLYRVMTINNL